MDLKAPKNINSSKNRSGIGGYLERHPNVQVKVIMKLKNKNILIQDIAKYVSKSGYGDVTNKGFNAFINKNKQYKKVKVKRPKGGPLGDPSDPERQYTQKRGKYDEIKKIYNEAKEAGDWNIFKSSQRGTGGKLKAQYANEIKELKPETKKFTEFAVWIGVNEKELAKNLNKRIKAIAISKEGARSGVVAERVKLQNEIYKIVSAKDYNPKTGFNALVKKLKIKRGVVQHEVDKLYKNIYAQRVAMGKTKAKRIASDNLSSFLPNDDVIIDRLLNNLNHPGKSVHSYQYLVYG